MSGSKKKLTDLIGERPATKREREKREKQKKTNQEKDALRQIALDKGLNPNF
jgi:hypothetical protein